LANDIKGQRDTPYKFKFRIDKGEVYPGVGIAIDDNIVQIIADPAIAREIMSGQELAIKQSFDGVDEVHVFNLRGASKALSEVLKNCPLDKQKAPTFDSDGDLNEK